MAIALLINKAKVSEVLQVAIGYNETEFNVFIREAQDFDLKPLMCEKFYHSLVKNRADASIYQRLLDGHTYQVDGIDIEFRGIAEALAYFAYARFVRKSNMVSTSHGIHQKETPYSSPVDYKQRKNEYYEYRTDANFIFAEVVKYIERNESVYTLWDCDDSIDCDKEVKYKSRVIQ